MSSGHRHSRAHVRHRFVRVALARRRAYLETMAGLESHWKLSVDMSLGRFADGQPYLGCQTTLWRLPPGQALAPRR